MARPRKYPPGEEPPNSAYLRESRRRLEERGGGIVQVRLEPEELAALERLKQRRGLTRDRDAIAAAILEAERS